MPTPRKTLVAAALIAVCALVPQAAQAGLQHSVVTPADAAEIAANGCTATKHADHSVAIRCPAGHMATLTWYADGHEPRASVTCRVTRCRFTPAVDLFDKLQHTDVWRITEQVHNHVVVSVTKSYGALP